MVIYRLPHLSATFLLFFLGSVIFLPNMVSSERVGMHDMMHDFPISSRIYLSFRIIPPILSTEEDAPILFLPPSSRVKQLTAQPSGYGLVLSFSGASTAIHW